MAESRQKYLDFYTKNILLIDEDPLLKPYETEIRARLAHYQKTKSDIEDTFGGLPAFASAYLYLGFNYDSALKGWWYREWAPSAVGLSLIGDFNGWDPFEHPMKKRGNGLWEIFLPDTEYTHRLIHGSRIKVHVKCLSHAMDRIPAYIRRVIQDTNTTEYSGQFWKPKIPFIWTDENFKTSSVNPLLIYECHPGMAQEKEGVGTWREFAVKILPKIKSLGYNCIQLMAVQEHPYYASFGYHVSNFYAPSCRFGTPEDLKYLINEAHVMGIAVVMDVVHSHAIKNFMEGLNQFDGTDFQYFHEGERGNHPAWDSKLFNYGKREVLMFLLSNLAYWIKEYHFDGFRFDGVTSMLFTHHGLGVTFDKYEKYFGADVDKDAMTYLRLANDLVHAIKPDAITIAEDMSGLPGTCRRIKEGGMGFDYRLAMGIPDFWIRLLKHSKDEDWSMFDLWNTLTNRRFNEANIAYAESHDQALVGDQTIAFRLMGPEMYYGMSKNQPNIHIDRGIALHKIIRLLTISLGGESYLNFMGNEFGHPDWIDFPREGNEWSYQYARRQWSLSTNHDLKYEWLNQFDIAMIRFVQSSGLLKAPFAQQLMLNNDDKILVYERGGQIFILNLHVSESQVGYKVRLSKAGSYTVKLNTDNPAFGGHDRVDESVVYHAEKSRKLGYFISIYIPNRTLLVLGKV